MPESTYTIIAVQPPPQSRGECGVSQSITLSLMRNEKPILDHIIFGDNCFKGPTVLSFEISEGLEGLDSRYWTLCVSPSERDAKACKFEVLGDSVKINQDALNKYSSKKNR
jgi:hypothetical protein